MPASQLSITIAFVAGLASFLSPCVLPLVPIYLAQLVGQGVYQSTNTQEGIAARIMTFLHAVTFVAGFTLAFVALGATASTLGSFLSTHLVILREIGGVLLVVLGLHVAGILKLPLLYQQKRIEFHPARPGYPASFLLGVVFAIAWSPCIGPILGSILVMAASAATLRRGVGLLLASSLGRGFPFLILGRGRDLFSPALKGPKPYLGKIEVVIGILLIGVGVVVFFNLLGYLNQYFTLS